MFRALFGDVAEGRLSRLPFLGYLVLLTVIVLAAFAGLIVILGAAEHLVSGDLQQAQAMLAQRFGLPLAIVTVIAGAVLLFAQLNITAKRARDTGLPGWLTVAAIVLVPAIFSGIVSQQAAASLNMLCILALLLIPTGLFARDNG